MIYLMTSVIMMAVLQTSNAGKCFSCMSRYYEATWNFAGYSQMYLLPRRFTDECARPKEIGHVPTVYCQDGQNCVTLIEELRIGVGARGYVRGCWSGIFLWGFNRTGASGALANREFCQTFNLSELIAGGKPFESVVRACSCSGMACNGATAASPIIELKWIFTLISACILILLLFVNP